MGNRWPRKIFKTKDDFLQLKFWKKTEADGKIVDRIIAIKRENLMSYIPLNHYVLVTDGGAALDFQGAVGPSCDKMKLTHPKLYNSSDYVTVGGWFKEFPFDEPFSWYPALKAYREVEN